MPTAKKEQTIDALRTRLADAKYLFFTNYAGLTVEEITRLRTELRQRRLKLRGRKEHVIFARRR